MEPAYCDGDLVLINPAATTVEGAVVVARHPFKNLEVIKFVHSVDDDGYISLESPGGADSAQFGRVPQHTVRGTVTFRWKKRS